jgi:putative nucleotidyltransferase with HDIG domain
MKEPLKLRVYLCMLYTFTAFLIFRLVSNNLGDTRLDISAVVFFTLLMALTESFTVDFKNISFSTSYAIVLAAYILFGPVTAMVISVSGILIRVIKSGDEYVHIFNTKILITLFNCCLYALALLFGNYLYLMLGGTFGTVEIIKNIVPICVFCLAYFLVTVVLLGIFFSLRIGDRSILFYIVSNFKLSILNHLAIAPLGLLAASIFYPDNYVKLSLFIFPLILARFTFSQYIEAKTKYVQTVDVIMRAMEARDRYTEGHSKRVAEISCTIAKELRYNEWRIDDINIAALLHDVGKIGIDDHILNKPDKLTYEEFEKIKKHPEIGFNIVSDIKDIDNVKLIVRHHHERYDGKGYPDGKKAEELPLEVFIVQLADSIDAMETNRPYRTAMGKEAVIAEIIKCKGTQFHPTVADAYLRLLEKNKVLMEAENVSNINTVRSDSGISIQRES